MRKLFCITATLASLSLAAVEDFRVVNFSSCVMDSKVGKNEQESLEGMQKQMSSLMENTEKELKEIAAKFEDTEYLDSLSPKAEEELKIRFQTLQEDLGRYQSQSYQILNQAKYQILQKMNGFIGKAAEKVAQESKINYVLNKEACFYIRPDLDITNQVVAEMDKAFDLEKQMAENNNVEKAKVGE